VISPSSGEVLGGFFFGHPEAGRFTEAHERIAEGIAGYAAIGLDNARLYARERSVASDLQRRLLPEVTAAPGFTVVGRYLAAATDSEVGGDWLDVIELSGGRTAFVIGDVMGRGLTAASTMGQIRTAIRAYALLDLPPGEVLRQASQLAAEMTGRQFITCVYAVHDPVDETLTYANAGHPAPAVIAPDGEISFLPERLGMPLRVGLAFEERVIPFRAGSAVVLYTDGLVERRGRTLPEGMAALRKALQTMDGDPASACDRMIADLTGGAHDDDVALLYARDDGAPRRVCVMELTCEPLVASRARRLVSSTLEAWGLADHRDAVAMVVTELISNAVRHSPSPRELRLLYTHGRLIVEVADGDDRPPRRIQAAAYDENHRGLYIVDILARRWGARSTPHGKVVWAELPL
jgi:serine phosphatase RsbU (regulator of sigma subunit)